MQRDQDEDHEWAGTMISQAKQDQFDRKKSQNKGRSKSLGKVEIYLKHILKKIQIHKIGTKKSINYTHLF